MFVNTYQVAPGTAFGSICELLFCLETVCNILLQNICGLRYCKNVLVGIKMRIHVLSLASGKTLVWPLSNLNLYHVDFYLA